MFAVLKRNEVTVFKILWLVFMLLAILEAGNAMAAPITVTLSDEEQNVFTSALDAYVKAGGLAVATNAAVMLQKLVAAKNAPPTKDKSDAGIPETKPVP